MYRKLKYIVTHRKLGTLPKPNLTSLAIVGLHVRQHWSIVSWRIYAFAKNSAYCIEVTLSSVRPAVWKYPGVLEHEFQAIHYLSSC